MKSRKGRIALVYNSTCDFKAGELAMLLEALPPDTTVLGFDKNYSEGNMNMVLQSESFPVPPLGVKCPEVIAVFESDSMATWFRGLQCKHTGEPMFFRDMMRRPKKYPIRVKMDLTKVADDPQSTGRSDRGTHTDPIVIIDEMSDLKPEYIESLRKRIKESGYNREYMCAPHSKSNTNPGDDPYRLPEIPSTVDEATLKKLRDTFTAAFTGSNIHVGADFGKLEQQVIATMKPDGTLFINTETKGDARVTLPAGLTATPHKPIHKEGDACNCKYEGWAFHPKDCHNKGRT